MTIRRILIRFAVGVNNKHSLSIQKMLELIERGENTQNTEEINEGLTNRDNKYFELRIAKSYAGRSYIVQSQFSTEKDDPLALLVVGKDFSDECSSIIFYNACENSNKRNAYIKRELRSLSEKGRYLPIFLVGFIGPNEDNASTPSSVTPVEECDFRSISEPPLFFLNIETAENCIDLRTIKASESFLAESEDDLTEMNDINDPLEKNYRAVVRSLELLIKSIAFKATLIAIWEPILKDIEEDLRTLEKNLEKETNNKTIEKINKYQYGLHRLQSIIVTEAFDSIQNPIHAKILFIYKKANALIDTSSFFSIFSTTPFSPNVVSHNLRCRSAGLLADPNGSDLKTYLTFLTSQDKIASHPQLLDIIEEIKNFKTVEEDNPARAVLQFKRNPYSIN